MSAKLVGGTMAVDERAGILRPPNWVRLVRQGNVVTGHNSPNGITSTLRTSVTFSNLRGTVYIGLAVSSSLNDGVLGTAVFDSVTRSP